MTNLKRSAKLNLKCLFFLPYIFFSHIKYALTLFSFKVRYSFHDVIRSVVGDTKAEKELGGIPEASYLDIGGAYPVWYSACTAGIHNMITKRFEDYLNTFRDKE